LANVKSSLILAIRNLAVPSTTEVCLCAAASIIADNKTDQHQGGIDENAYLLFIFSCDLAWPSMRTEKAENLRRLFRSARAAKGVTGKKVRRLSTSASFAVTLSI
jgi:hypothetical protein